MNKTSERVHIVFLFTVIDLTMYDDALYRVLAHNGEINTLRGNVNLMRAREGVMHSQVYGDQLKKLYPVVEEGMTDSGCVDNALEFLWMAGGRELPEVSRGHSCPGILSVVIITWFQLLIAVTLYPGSICMKFSHFFIQWNNLQKIFLKITSYSYTYIHCTWNPPL